jgi:hypothetical protein
MRGERWVVEVALGSRAAELEEGGRDLGGFDSLGDDAESEAVGEVRCNATTPGRRSSSAARSPDLDGPLIAPP